MPARQRATANYALRVPMARVVNQHLVDHEAMTRLCEARTDWLVAEQPVDVTDQRQRARSTSAANRSASVDPDRP